MFLSEVTACWTMAEAVALYETAEATDRVYMFGENYCYFYFIQEMRKLYREGVIGNMLFADGQYEAVYRPIWTPYCRNYNEWRNWMPQSYYTSHTVGPLIYVTGLKPVEVTGFATPVGECSMSMGKLADEVANFAIKFDSGAMGTFTTNFIAARANHLWWHISGEKGEMENDRYGEFNGMNVVTDEGHKHYVAEPPYDAEIAESRTHAGGDYYIITEFVRSILDKTPVIIDAKLAVQMCVPGILAHRSAIQGGVKMQIPDLATLRCGTSIETTRPLRLLLITNRAICRRRPSVCRSTTSRGMDSA